MNVWAEVELDGAHASQEWNVRLSSTTRSEVASTHFAARAFTFGRARIENPGPDEESRWTVPLVFVGAFVLSYCP